MKPSEEIGRVVDEQMQRIRLSLKDRMPHIVAEGTGLHVNTISAIKRGVAGWPQKATLRKLEDYLFPEA